jgi:hypothetical protein
MFRRKDQNAVWHPAPAVKSSLKPTSIPFPKEDLQAKLLFRVVRPHGNLKKRLPMKEPAERRLRKRR